MKHVIFSRSPNSAGEAAGGFLLQGLTLILFGILTLVMPELLLALVSFFFMALGALMLWFAYISRKFGSSRWSVRNFFWDDF